MIDSLIDCLLAFLIDCLIACYIDSLNTQEGRGDGAGWGAEGGRAGDAVGACSQMQAPLAQWSMQLLQSASALVLKQDIDNNNVQRICCQQDALFEPSEHRPNIAQQKEAARKFPCHAQTGSCLLLDYTCQAWCKVSSLVTARDCSFP